MSNPVFSLRQEIVSVDPKDASEPRGFIFAFRSETVARIVFADNSVRDVPMESLRSLDTYVTSTGPVAMPRHLDHRHHVPLYVIAADSTIGRVYFNGVDWTTVRYNAQMFSVCSSAVDTALQLSASVPAVRLTVRARNDLVMRAVQAGAVSPETLAECVARTRAENDGDTPPEC